MKRLKRNQYFKLFLCLSFMISATEIVFADDAQKQIIIDGAYITPSADFSASKAQIEICKKSVFAVMGNSCDPNNKDLLDSAKGDDTTKKVLEEMTKSGSVEADKVSQLANKAAAKLGFSQKKCETSAYKMKESCIERVEVVVDKELDMCKNAANLKYTNPDPASVTQKNIAISNCETQAQEYKSRGSVQYKLGWAKRIAFLALTAAALIKIKKLLKDSNSLKKDISVDTAANANNPNYDAGHDRDVVRPELSNDNGSVAATAATTSSSSNNALANASSTVNVKDFEGYDPAQEYKATVSSNTVSSKSGSAYPSKASNVNVGASTSATEVGANGFAGSMNGSYGSNSSGIGDSSSGGSINPSGNRELAAYMPGGQKDPRTDAVRKYEEARSQIRPPHGYSNFDAIHKVASKEFPN